MDYYSDYDSTFDSFTGGMAIFGLILIGLLLAFIIVVVVAEWKMYKKAGKGGWECIVPIYSYWVLAEIAGLNWWWFLLAISDSIVSLLGFEELSTISNLVSLFASFNIYYNIAKKFNKSTGTAVCAGLFPGILVLNFGLSKNAVYDANIPVSKNGIFGTPEGNFNNNVNNQSSTTTTSTTSVDNNVSGSEFVFCGNCGTKMSKDTKFCPTCGKENV